MRFKTMFLLVMMLVVAASAMAKLPPKTLEYPIHPVSMDNGPRDMFESFEGVFPPAGWALSTTNPDNTWVQGTSAFDGDYAAHVDWQYGVPQDEVLSFTYTVLDGNHLTFATMGSAYWSMNANLTCEIDGAVVYDYYNDNLAGSWAWDIVDIDLAAWVGATVEIAFRYAGDDGADQELDAVEIGGGFVPPEPPENDTCDGAIMIENGAFSITGSTVDANNDYDPEYGGCTGWSAGGMDVVYSFCLDAGETFSVTMTTDGFDDSIYLVTDCTDVVGSCVAGDDAYPDGSTFEYTADADNQFYLIVDGYSGSGEYLIEGFNGGDACSTPSEDSSWSEVKASY